MAQSSALRSRFGHRVKASLAETGLTLDDLATRAGLPLTRVERILCGTLVRLTLRDMTLIAGAVGTPLFRLLAPLGAAVPAVAIEEIEQRGARHA